MKNNLSIVIVIACALFCFFHTAYCKGKLAVVVPKKAKGKPKGTPIWRSFGQSVIGKVFREMKVAFSSELEALALQVTKPTNTAVPLEPIETIAASVNEAYDDPEYVIGLLAKFSRKLSEDNVHTKIKSLLSIQLIMQKASDKAQAVLSKCVNSLRSEKDNKVNSLFFSIETIERLADSPGVSDVAMVELAREYAVYLFEYMDAKGDKVKIKNSGNDRVDSLLSLIEQGEAVEDSCRRCGGPLAKQILERIKDDRNWASKQLLKLSEAGISDETLESDVIDMLEKLGFSVPQRAQQAEVAKSIENKGVEEEMKPVSSLKSIPQKSVESTTTPTASKAVPKLTAKPSPKTTTNVAQKSASNQLKTAAKTAAASATPVKTSPAKRAPAKAAPAKTSPKKTLKAASAKVASKKIPKKRQHYDEDDD